MNIGGIRISKKFTAMVAGVAFAEYLRRTGQTLDEVLPVMQLAAVYICGQSAVDMVKEWRGKQ